MIWYLALLGIVLYASLYYLGEDTGQWINPPEPQARNVMTVPQARQVFIPAQPVMQASESASDLPAAASLTTGELPALPVELVSQSVGPTAATGASGAGRLLHAPAGANVRSGPGSNFAIIATIRAGDAVLVADQTASGNWVQVAGDGGSGWVARRLLRE